MGFAVVFGELLLFVALFVMKLTDKCLWNDCRHVKMGMICWKRHFYGQNDFGEVSGNIGSQSVVCTDWFVVHALQAMKTICFGMVKLDIAWRLLHVCR